MVISEGENDGKEVITSDEKCGELGQTEDEDADDVADATETGEAVLRHLVRQRLHEDDLHQHHGHQGQAWHEVDHQQVQDETENKFN